MLPSFQDTFSDIIWTLLRNIWSAFGIQELGADAGCCSARSSRQRPLLPLSKLWNFCCHTHSSFKELKNRSITELPFSVSRKPRGNWRNIFAPIESAMFRSRAKVPHRLLPRFLDSTFRFAGLVLRDRESRSPLAYSRWTWLADHVTVVPIFNDK